MDVDSRTRLIFTFPPNAELVQKLLSLAADQPAVHIALETVPAQGAVANGAVNGMTPSAPFVHGLRAKKKEGHPDEFYKPLILSVLAHAPERTMKGKSVIEEIGRRLDGQLDEVDRGLLPKTGEPRWENRIHWARHGLMASGMLHKSAEVPYGCWKLTDKGVKMAPRA